MCPYSGINHDTLVAFVFFDPAKLAHAVFVVWPRLAALRAMIAVRLYSVSGLVKLRLIAVPPCWLWKNCRVSGPTHRYFLPTREISVAAHSRAVAAGGRTGWRKSVRRSVDKCSRKALRQRRPPELH
jgi:hypothetical protein